MVGWMVTRFFETPKMSRFLYENHRGSPTLILLNVLGVLGVLNVLHVLNMPVDASLTCWALLIRIPGPRPPFLAALKY